jgi:hypothetical protein
VRLPVRSADGELFDTFLVSAVATLLLIRIFLEATGYPQLGGRGLHIAHVLWGGLGMLLAIVLLLLFLSPRTRLVAAVVGGAGFGAFIDELGKFVTSDNNYFFKPTAAIVYLLFVVLFFVVRQVRISSALTPAENLVNAVELAEQLVVGELSQAERDRALAMLAASDQSDPMVGVLRDRFLAAHPRLSTTTAIDRWRANVIAWYRRVASTAWFHRVIAALFILQGIGIVLSGIAALAMLIGASLGIADAIAALAEATEGSTVASWIQIVATFVGGAFVVAGVVRLRHSRVRAYRAFEIAILLELLLVLPFAFLSEGFGTFVEVLLDLALLAILRFLETQEVVSSLQHQHAT